MVNVYRVQKNVYHAVVEFVLHVLITSIQANQEKAVLKTANFLVLHVKITSRQYVNLASVDQL